MSSSHSNLRLRTSARRFSSPFCICFCGYRWVGGWVVDEKIEEEKAV